MNNYSYNQLRYRITYTLRRFYVDEFFKKQASLIDKEKLILDVGGKKVNKRGTFHFDDSKNSILYINVDTLSTPDMVGDGSHLPFKDRVADVVILGEVLEHVPFPTSVIREACRVLKGGGVLLATVPFLYPLHADPHDYSRLTDYFLREQLELAGFSSISVKKQGLYFGVLAMMIRMGLSHLYQTKFKNNPLWQSILIRIGRFITLKSLELDVKYSSSSFVKAYTTGFEIRAVR